MSATHSPTPNLVTAKGSPLQSNGRLSNPATPNQTGTGTHSDARVVKITDSSLTLSWEANLQISQYRIEMLDLATGEFQVVGSGIKDTTFQVNNLTPATPYHFRVSGETWVVCTDTVTCSPLSPPKTITPSLISPSRATLTWEAMVGVDGYLVELAQGDAATQRPQRFEPVRETSENTTDVELVPGVETVFRVRAGQLGVFEEKGTTCAVVGLSPVENVNITALTDSSVALSWTQVTAATHYKLAITCVSQQSESISTTATNSAHLVGLATGLLHELTIYAGRHGIFEPTGHVISFTPLAAVKQLHVSQIEGHAGCVVEWNDVPGAGAYRIRTRPVSGGEWSQLSTVTECSTRIDTLHEGGSLVRVVACADTAQDCVAESVGAEVVATALAPVGPLSLTELGSDFATVQWDPIATVEEYRVTYTREDSPEAAEVTVGTTTATTVKVGSLAPGVAHTLSVRSGHGGVFHSQASSLRVTPLIPPHRLRVLSVTTSSAVVAAELPPQNPAQQFILEVATADKDFTKIHEGILVEEILAGVEVSGLESGVLHRIRARSGTGGVYESTGAVVEATPLSPPTNLTVTGVTATSGTVEWDPVMGCQEYTVQVQDTVTGEWNTVLSLPGSASSATIRGLLPNVLCNVRVIAGLGCGVFESVGAVGTLTPLPAVEHVEVLSFDATSVTLAWDAPPVDGVRYAVQYTAPGKEFETAASDVADCRYQVSGLRSGATYLFRVGISHNGIPAEDYSEHVKCVPLGSVTNLAASQLSPSTFEITWTPTPGAGYYRVESMMSGPNATPGDFECIVSRVVQPRVLMDGLVGAYCSVYVVRVTAGCETAGLSSEAEQVTCYLLDKVTGIKVVSLHARECKLSWPDVTGADQYRVQHTAVDADAPSEADPVVETHVASVDLAGLTAGEPRKVFVTPRNTRSTAPTLASGFCTDTLIIHPLSPPEKIEVGRVTSHSVDIQWSPCRGATVYQIAKLGAGGAEEVIVPSCRTTEHTIRGLEYGVPCELILHAGSSTGVFEAVGAKVDILTLPPPKDIAVEVSSETSIVVSWQSQHEACQHFKVTVQSEGGQEIEHEITSGLSTNVSGLAPGGRYTVCVYAGQGESFESVGCEISGVVLQAIHMSLTLLSDSEIHVAWKPVPCADAYSVCVCPIDGSGQPITAEICEIAAQTTDTHARAAGLAAGVPYEVQVRALQSKGFHHRDGSRLTAIPLPSTAKVSASGLTHSRVDLAWDEVPSAKWYQVCSVVDGAVMDVLADRLNECHFSVTDVEPGSRVAFRIFAGSGESAECVGADLSVVPLQPVSRVSIDTLQAASLRMVWDAVAGAQVYRVELDAGEGTWTTLSVCSQCQFVLSGLSPGQLRRVRIFAGATAELGESSVAVFETVGCVVQVKSLLPVQHLKPVSVGPDCVSLEWRGVTGADIYLVEFRNSPDSEWVEYSTVEGNVHAIDVLGVAEAVPHELRIRSGFHLTLPGGAVSSVMQPKGTVVTAMPLGSPADVRILDVTASTVMIGWDPVPGAEVYKVETINSNGDSTLVTDCAVGDSLTVTGLSAGSQYSFVVFAGRNGVFECNGWEEVAVTLDHVNELKILKVKSRLIGLSWQHVEGAAYYQVEQKAATALDTEYVVVAGEVSKARVGVSGVKTGVHNTFRVKAGFMAADGSALYESVGATLNATALSPPQNVLSRIVGPDTIGLTWDPVPGASVYKLEIRPMDSDRRLTREFTREQSTEDGLPTEGAIAPVSSFTVVSDTIPQTSFNIAGLATGECFIVRVKAGANGAFEMEGTEELVTALGTVRQLRVDHTSADTVHVSWEHVPGAVEYMVTWTLGSEVNEMVCEVDHCQVSGLQSGATYTLTVFAGALEKFEPHGASIEITPLRSCSPPTIASLGADTVSLEWKPVPGASFYRIARTELDPTGNAMGAPVTIAAQCVTPRYTAAGLSVGQPCRFTVFAGREGVCEQGGAWVNVTPLESIADLAVSDLSDSEVHLEWTAPRGATQFRLEQRILVERGDKEEFEVISEVIAVPHVRLGGLAPGIRNQIRIGAGAHGVFENSPVTVTFTPLAAPTHVTYSADSNTSVALVWSPVEGAERYRVERKRPTEKDWNVISDTITASRFTVTGVVSGEENLFRVSSGADGVFESQGCVVGARTVNAVQGLKIAAVTSRSVSLEWHDVSGAEYYQIEYRPHDAPDSAFTVYTDNEPSTHCVVDGLTSGKMFTFRIWAGRDGVFSAVARTIDGVPLDTPTTVMISDLCSDTLTLSWAPVEGAETYTVQQRLASEEDGQFVELTKTLNVPHFRAVGLVAGTEYVFRLSAGACGAFETRGALISATPLEPVSHLHVSALTHSSVTLAWDPSPGALNYRIEFKPTASSDHDYVIMTRDHEATSLVLPRLAPGVSHTFRVSAGLSADVFELAGATINASPLDRPEPVRVKSIDATSCELHWTLVEGAQVYRVERRQLSDKSFTLVSNVLRGDSHRITGLHTGATYELQVRSGIDQMFSDDTCTVRVTPLASVAGLAVNSVTSSSAALTWKPSPGASHYKVQTRHTSSGGWTDYSGCADLQATSLVVRGLRCGEETEFRVLSGGYCCDARGEWTLFEAGGSVVTAVPLAAPGAVTAIPVANGIRLQWDGVPGANCYTVEMMAPEDRFETLADSIDEAYFDVSGLEQGTAHLFRVRSGHSGVFETAGTLLDLTTLDTVHSVSVEGVTSDTATLKWIPAHGATKYSVRFQLEDGSGVEQVIEVAAPTTVLTGLDRARLYRAAVFAGNSSMFEEQGSQPVAFMPLTPVSQLKAMTMDATTIELTWHASDGATRYIVWSKLLSQKGKGEELEEDNDFELVSDMVTGCRLILRDMAEYGLYKFVVYAAHGTSMEHVGETVEMREDINLNPKTAKELENTIDTLIWRQLRMIEEEIPGITDIVGKMAPNQYHVGDKIVHLNLQKGSIVVRVGGGYMEFYAWIMKHKYAIARFMASTAQTISSRSRVASVPTMVRTGDLPQNGLLQTAGVNKKHKEILEKGSQRIEDAAMQSVQPSPLAQRKSRTTPMTPLTPRSASLKSNISNLSEDSYV